MKMVKFAAIMAGLLLVTQVFADEQKFENINQYFEYICKKSDELFYFLS